MLELSSWRQRESTCDVYLLSSHLLHVDERKSLLRKRKIFFGIFRCISVLWITAACYSPLTFFAVQAGISIVLLSPSLVFIMMVCYFYIFQRFNLQLFFASHTRFTFYKLSLLLSKDMKKKVQYSQFHFISRCFFVVVNERNRLRIENQCSLYSHLIHNSQKCRIASSKKNLN